MNKRKGGNPHPKAYGEGGLTQNPGGLEVRGITKSCLRASRPIINYH